MKRVFILFLTLFIFFSAVSPAFAQQSFKESGCLLGRYVAVIPGRVIRITNSDNVATLSCIPVVLGNIFFWGLTFSGIVALFIVIFSGIKLLTSGGDPKNIEGAKKTLTWAIIGLIIILSSIGILTFIAQTTNIELGCLGKFGLSHCS